MNCILSWSWHVWISAAPVENRHKRTRDQADPNLQYENLAARYCVRESLSQHDRRRSEAQLLTVCVDGSETSVPETVPMPNMLDRILTAKRQLVPHQISAMNRLVDERARGRKRSSRVFAAVATDDVSALTASVAPLTKFTAHRNRRTNVAASSIAANSSSSSSAPAPAAAISAAIIAKPMAAAALSPLDAWASTEDTDVPIFASSRSLCALSSESHDNSYPLSATKLNRIIGHSSGKKLVQSFRNTVSHIAGVGVENMGTVTYPSQCSALCRDNISKQEYAMAVRFLKQLERFRVSLCKPGSFHMHDVVVAVELTFGLDYSPRVIFAALPHTFGRKAQIAARYSFVLLEPSGTGTVDLGQYVGKDLWISFEDFIETRYSIFIVFPLQRPVSHGRTRWGGCFKCNARGSGLRCLAGCDPRQSLPLGPPPPSASPCCGLRSRDTF